MASFSCVLLALLGPLRALSERPLRITGLCLLLLPGASEALIRGSNDGLLFLWAALVLLALKKSTQPWWLLALMAAGPLIKLSAFPIVAYAIGRLWMRSRRAEAVMAGSISMLVLPVQFLRGWKWGGTYELNRVAGGALPPPMTVLKGGARSVYSFGKTISWLGGWNSFREPKLLVVAWFILAALWLLAIRPAGSKSEAMAFVLGLVVALAGFGVLAVGNWRLFHDWGGLGGWYAWGWAPWLALGLPLSIRTPREVTRLLAAASLVFLVAVNVAWFQLAVRQYGPRTQAPHTRGVLTSDSPAAS